MILSRPIARVFLFDFSLPSRDLADLCLGIAILHLQAFSASPQPSRSLASPRATPLVPLQAFWAAPSRAKPHSIPSRLVRLSSINSIGSAHARLLKSSLACADPIDGAR